VVVGGVELEPLADAVGSPGTLAEFYSGLEPQDWRRAHTEYPQLFGGESWRLPVTCYLVWSAGRTVLVDTGVGPPGLWSWQAEWAGRLPAGLAKYGLEPADVDDVLLTHDHIDHVGWNATAEGEPLFARYVIHADALAAARRRADEPHIRRCLLGLEERLETISGATALAPNVTAFALPGHAAGHLGVRLGTEAILIVDAIPHPVMLDRPESRFLADDDPELAATTRASLREELVDRPVLTVCGHYPGSGIGRAVTREGHVVWEPA
jgi:glyoxylase-like metal-dependent hydrolase (beta-lactamase superfamily II)